MKKSVNIYIFCCIMLSRFKNLVRIKLKARWGVDSQKLFNKTAQELGLEINLLIASF